MKKLLLCMFALFILSGSAFAQKGTWYLGASGMRFWSSGSSSLNQFYTGFSYDKIGSTSIISVGLAPEAGYFFADKWAVGLGFGLGFSISGQDDLNRTTLALGINPYVRYYFWSIGNFSIYAQGGLSYTNYDGNILFVGINPGIAYSFNEHFGMNASFGSLGYTNYGDDNNSFGVILTPSTLNFGISYVF